LRIGRDAATLHVMITLARRRATLSVSRLMWDAAQVFARQEGWRPDGVADRSVQSAYSVGRSVSAPEARRLADALVRVVNGPKADGGELDVARLAELVNFLRGGAFEIR
jgi:hypothetical protein